MDEKSLRELEKVALDIRKDVVRMTGVARSGELRSGISAVEIVTYLYWREMNVSPVEPRMKCRDRFVLGKASASPVLYAALARKGFFSREELWSYRRLGAILQGCPDIRTPGIDAPGGGHGIALGVAAGMALALSMDGSNARVFCLAGDGELQEGAMWESLFSASCRSLGRLALIVDADGRVNGAPLDGLRDASEIRRKIESFGWSAAEADGNDIASIDAAFSATDWNDPAPKAFIMRTTRGKGLPVDDEDMDIMLSKLEGGVA